ncbi:hypothetical protein A9Q98_12435 [Thalassotalea sp. 42_200_T64]|nr:hypothetical protein A9Q98_12435 [Thalassotalea sp. 42_200_T64]
MNTIVSPSSTKTSFSLLPYLLTASLVLTACGGDSGGGGSDNDPDTAAPIITLQGDSAVTLGDNEAYTDAGATATDDVDGTVTVTTTGSVDTAAIGSYTITYTATDAAGNSTTMTRTVTVADMVAPVISLTGGAEVNVFVNDTYTEPVLLQPMMSTIP